MTVSSSVFNRVLLNDGEGADYGDLNNMQKYLQAHLLDGIIGCQARTDLPDLYPSASYLWTPSSVQAAALAGGSTRQITNGAGWIGQWSSAGQSDGQTPKLLMFRLAAGDLVTTLAAGGSNHRWDGIFVKVTEVSAAAVQRDFATISGSTLAKSTTTMSVSTRTQLDVSVVSGAEASVPSYPATPAGYVPWAYVYVPSGFNSTFDYDKISDARIPMRMSSVTVYANQMLIGAAGYTLNSAKSHLAGNTNGEEAIALFPGPLDARILRITTEGSFASSLVTAQAKRYALRGSSYTEQTPGARAISSFTHSSGGSSQQLLAPASGAGNAGSFWGTGHPGGPGFYITGGDSGSNGAVIQERAGVLLSDDGSGGADWAFVRFDYAY